MSPSVVLSASKPKTADGLGLSIVGMGVDNPPYLVGPQAIETLAERYHKKSVAMDKVLQINKHMGIERRTVIDMVDHPLVNQSTPPSITQLNDVFMDHGVQMSTSASQKAIADWGGDVSEITHVVSTTCTNSANPGFDYYVCRNLGLGKHVEKILLHGIGCSGGLAAIRTACNLALGFSFLERPARVLVIACEICTTLVRSELESIDQTQQTRIGCCLFSDGASACVISNDIGDCSEPIYDLLGWKHEVLADSDKDLRFDVDPQGWKVVLTPQVPIIAANSVELALKELLRTVPKGFHSFKARPTAQGFDWALHPGGSAVITGVQQALKLPDDALMASKLVYTECGSSSSAAVTSVMDRLRKAKKGKVDVVACAFGPGVLVEMMLMKRRQFPAASDHVRG